LLGMMPSSGNNTRGTNAVTASEVPSPTHHIAIKATTANMRCALSVIPSGSGMSKIPQDITSPAKSTTICFLNAFSIKGGSSKRVQRIDINRGKKQILFRRDGQTYHWERNRLINTYCHRSVSSRMRAGKDLVYFEGRDDVGVHSQLCGCVAQCQSHQLW